MDQAHKVDATLTGAMPLLASGCANTAEKTGEYVDDSWIAAIAKAEMTADKEVSAHNINVDTARGVITLTGTAATDHESKEAADIVRRIKGVVSVANDIHVQAVHEE